VIKNEAVEIVLRTRLAEAHHLAALAAEGGQERVRDGVFIDDVLMMFGAATVFGGKIGLPAAAFLGGDHVKAAVAGAFLNEKTRVHREARKANLRVKAGVGEVGVGRRTGAATHLGGDANDLAVFLQNVENPEGIAGEIDGGFSAGEEMTLGVEDGILLETHRSVGPPRPGVDLRPGADLLSDEVGDKPDPERERKNAQAGDRGDEEVFHEIQEIGGK